MKKVLIALLTGLTAWCGNAETTLVFGFDTTDSGADVNGIEYGGIKQTITFSGAVSGSDTLFTQLDGKSSSVNFLIGAVGDLSSFSGTMTPVGGGFNIGGNGGGVEGGASSSYFDSGEAWTFTFSSDVILTAARYYAADSGGQTVLTNGVAVAGSPFDDDFSGAGIYVRAGDSLTFGQAGTGNYALQDFTITAVPEPATFAMLGIGGLLIAAVRRAIV